MPDLNNNDYFVLQKLLSNIIEKQLNNPICTYHMETDHYLFMKGTSKKA